MAEIPIPKSLHEVLGEKQSLLEIVSIFAFAFVGSAAIYGVLYHPSSPEVTWQVAMGFILIVDVLAGCVANFTRGTNLYYASRRSSRLMFIAIHFHVIAIAWLLGESILLAWMVWVYTITSALVVNSLNGHRLQLFVSACLMCVGLLLLLLLPLEPWFLACSLFFMIKVVFSFAVDHYTKIE
ncbi:hypothetical protein JZN58_000113 [Vibrio vulnificus]|nr:hypothetical protein [Vibrio vulnificus]